MARTMPAEGAEIASAKARDRARSRQRFKSAIEGYLKTDPELVRLYGNRLAEGHPGEYREWSKLVGLEEIGPLLSRGAATADFDNDGDLDVAINQIGSAAVILRNEGGNEAGHWLKVQLEGFHPGAVVTVTLPDGRQLRREWHTGSSYLSSEDPHLHFGLGEATIVPELHVRWPDGREKTLENIPADQLQRIESPVSQAS